MGFHNLEADAAAGQLLVRIGAVLALGVEHCHGGGDIVAVGQMVVADDKVDAEPCGIGHLFHGLDAAVKGNNQLHPSVAGVVNAFK